MIVLATLATLAAACNPVSPTEPRSSVPGVVATATPSTPPALPTPPPFLNGPSTAAFNEIKAHGAGATSLRFTIPVSVPSVTALTSIGKGKFTVTSIAADGSVNDPLVDVTGSYAGTVLFDARTGEHSVAFRIEASGPWTVAIWPATAAVGWPVSAKLTGQGDDVFGVAPPPIRPVALEISNTDPGLFALIGYDANGPDVIVDEAGPYTGRAQLATGTTLLAIRSNGAWSVVPAH